MAKGLTISQPGFEKFLSWLDKDREAAGQKYEDIRLRLIKIFQARGCFEAEELADESLDRLIKKSDLLMETYQGDPALYCYKIAHNVFLESLRKPKTEELLDSIPQKIEIEELDEDYECLIRCLKKLSRKEYYIILKYYEGEKRVKINQRKKLEEELKITNQYLRVWVSRIRKVLQKCIQNCMNQRTNKNFDETFC